MEPGVTFIWKNGEVGNWGVKGKGTADPLSAPLKCYFKGVFKRREPGWAEQTGKRNLEIRGKGNGSEGGKNC